MDDRRRIAAGGARVGIAPVRERGRAAIGDLERNLCERVVLAIEADFARFAPGTPLRGFFEKRPILDRQPWQDVILKGRGSRR